MPKKKTKKKTSSTRSSPLSHLMPLIVREVIKPRIDACFQRHQPDTYRDLAASYLELFDAHISVGTARQWAKACGYEFRASLTVTPQLAPRPIESPPFRPSLTSEYNSKVGSPLSVVDRPDPLIAPHAQASVETPQAGGGEDEGFDNRPAAGGPKAPGLFLQDPGNSTALPGRLSPLGVEALSDPNFDPAKNPLNQPVPGQLPAPGESPAPAEDES